MNSHAGAVGKCLPAQLPWIWCKCILRNFIHSKIFNLSKYREVLVTYSLLITHVQNAELNLTPVTGTTNGFIFQIINSLIESWGVRLTCLDCNECRSTSESKQSLFQQFYKKYISQNWPDTTKDKNLFNVPSNSSLLNKDLTWNQSKPMFVVSFLWPMTRFVLDNPKDALLTFCFTMSCDMQIS